MGKVGLTASGFVILFIVNASWSPTRSFAGEQLSRVKGTVSDENGALIGGAKIIFTNDATNREIVTDFQGTYDVELLAGSYNIVVRSAGFCPFQRSQFQITASNIFTLNMKLRSGGSHSQCFQEGFDLPKPHSFVRIQYGERQEQRDTIEYREILGSELGDHELRAIYDGISIRAEKIRYSKASHLIEAEGNVIIERKGQVIKARRAHFDYRAKDPIVQLEK